MAASQTRCGSCGAGGVFSFNWEYAKSDGNPQLRRDLSVFVRPRELRHGTLYECASCRQPWYLYGDPQFMNVVATDRIDLIERWNGQPIVLGQDHSALLRAIGRTPPDQYGNGRQFHETPCAITTASGEEIELAIVSVQRHAPFEHWRNYRLATEISAVRPSPRALPLSVREASSRADEIRMGLAPTLVETPSRVVLALNWTQSFLVSSDCAASDVVLSSRQVDWSHPPPVHRRPDGIVYFVADEFAS